MDVVSIGEIDENQEKLEFFVKTVNKDNNRLVGKLSYYAVIVLDFVSWEFGGPWLVFIRRALVTL